MNKVSVSHFCELLVDVFNVLIHEELETIPFECISNYRKELMYLYRRLEIGLDPERLAKYFDLSPESIKLCDTLFDRFVKNEHTLVLLYVIRTLLNIYDLQYGLKSISTNCCKEA